MAFEERVVEDVKWDEPKSIVGYLVALRMVEVDGRRSPAFTIKNGQGKLFRFFSSSELDSKLLVSDVGSAVMVDFTGSETLPNGKKKNHFRVKVDSANRIEGLQNARNAALEITDDDIPS